jgi:hypothetical protein
MYRNIFVSPMCNVGDLIKNLRVLVPILGYDTEGHYEGWFLKVVELL